MVSDNTCEICRAGYPSAALVQEDRRLLVPPTTTVWLQASTVA